MFLLITYPLYEHSVREAPPQVAHQCLTLKEGDRKVKIQLSYMWCKFVQFLNPLSLKDERTTKLFST